MPLKRISRWVAPRLVTGYQWLGPRVAGPVRWATARPKRWYELHGVRGLLFLGLLLLGLTAMTYFFLLVRGVFFRGFEQVDLGILRWIHDHRTPVLDTLFYVMTTMGDPFTLAWGTVLIAGVTAWYRRWWDTAGAVMVIVGGLLLNLALKEFGRVRPDLGVHIVEAHGASFPSGHAMVSLCFYGYVAYLTLRKHPTYQRRLLHLVGATVLIILIGISRPYFGVHFPSDILAGWCAGLGWLLGNIAILEMQRDLGGTTPVHLLRRLRNRSHPSRVTRVEHQAHVPAAEAGGGLPEARLTPEG